MNETRRIERMEELKRLSEQFVDFLYEYGNVHTTIIINQEGVKITQDECFTPFKIRD
jgi:hypothetical protein